MSTPEEGHQFHFSVMVQGVYRGADGLHHDAPEPIEYTPFTITVRAWNLPDACAKAAQLPLAEWKHERGDGDRLEAWHVL